MRATPWVKVFFLSTEKTNLSETLTYMPNTLLTTIFLSLPLTFVDSSLRSFAHHKNSAIMFSTIADTFAGNNQLRSKTCRI